VDLRDLLFRFVILGSPETPKGPGEGPLAGLGRIGGRRPKYFRAALRRSLGFYLAARNARANTQSIHEIAVKSRLSFSISY
jgi:hypothetical protein